MARAGFDRELNELRTEVIAIGSLVEINLMLVTKALIERNDIVAQNLIDADKDINRRYINIVMGGLGLIATQQPMARDMRLIAAVIEIAGELERIHDYIKGIAKTSLEIGSVGVLPGIADDLPHMTRLTQDMLSRAMLAFSQNDALLAQTIPAADNLVDDLFNRIYREIIKFASQDPSLIPYANQYEWVIHNVERSADRVINICEWVVYLVTGVYREFESEYDAPPMR